MKYQILEGDNRQTLKTLADNSIDAIVTDPPYGIDFLGKQWDANTGALETYQECLRVLKPGGHILAFSAARTYHHLAVTLEQAGFEIRDQIMWIYSSGFPKSQDIGRSIQRSLGVKEHYTLEEYEKLTGCTNLPSGKDTLGHYNEGDGHKSAGLSGKIAKVTDPEAVQWAGWGTALKPAHEPIALARKPLGKGLSIAKNCQQWGVGALNIDATRIPTDDQPTAGKRTASFHTATGGGETQSGGDGSGGWEASDIGRFPSNVIGEIAEPYQKYFYCPKVSRRERHAGYDIKKVPVIEFNDPGKIKEHPLWDPSIGTNVQRLKEKIRLHNESCIPTDSSGSQGTSNGGNYLEKKQGVVTETDKLLQMGGYFLDDNNLKTHKSSKNIWLPQTGAIYAHGLNDEYRKWCEANGMTPNVGNNHPTVKPIELMKYLIKLITPPGGIVLDPFNGSGSTGCAAVALGHEYIGCELDSAYVEIANKRIEAWNKQHNNFEALFSAA